MRITDNERALLRAILGSDFQEAASPVNNPVWIDCIEGFSDRSKYGGTLASAVKKGLAGCDSPSRKKDRCCWITAAGIAALQATD